MDQSDFLVKSVIAEHLYSKIFSKNDWILLQYVCIRRKKFELKQFYASRLVSSNSLQVYFSLTLTLCTPHVIEVKTRLSQLTQLLLKFKDFIIYNFSTNLV